MPNTLHTARATGAMLGVRCLGCDHRAVLSPVELPIIRRGNMKRLRDLKLRCGHCGARGQAPDQFTLHLPPDREAADGFMRGGDAGAAAV